jgi:large repetitive protein
MRQRHRSRPSYTKIAATLVSLTVLATSTVVALLAFSGGKASAVQSVSCGDTITADTTLHHNLVNCPNNGIIIGADDVTLDLNYHTIDGDGTPAAGCDPETEDFCDVGVGSDGHDGVTVVHGRVRQFSVGAQLDKSRHTRLLGLSAVRNGGIPGGQGIILYKATRSLVRNSSGNNSSGGKHIGTGLACYYVRHSRILDSSFRHNVDHGIFVYKSAHNRIKGNLTSHTPGEGGITLNGSDRNRVTRNRSVRDGVGLFVSPGNRNVITRNRFTHAGPRFHGDGQAIEIPRGDHNLIARNRIRGTREEAIGLGFDEGVGNVVRRNHIRGAGADGIHVAWGPKKGATRSNVVRRNHILGAGQDGVHVDKKAEHTLVKSNHAFSAKDDGIDVDNPKAKLTRNEARRNGDLGIEAIRGVIDGGGNKASGNGDPRQCTNVVCR